jgi:hypothetical protein
MVFIHCQVEITSFLSDTIAVDCCRSYCHTHTQATRISVSLDLLKINLSKKLTTDVL